MPKPKLNCWDLFDRVRYMMKTRVDNKMIDCIVSMEKKIMNFHDQLNLVQSVMKTRGDNDMTDHTSEVYAKINIELSWLIRPGANYDENHMNNYVSDCTKMVYTKNETKLS